MRDTHPITQEPSQLLNSSSAKEIDRLIGEVRGPTLIIERLHLGADVGATPFRFYFFHRKKFATPTRDNTCSVAVILISPSIRWLKNIIRTKNNAPITNICIFHLSLSPCSCGCCSPLSSIVHTCAYSLLYLILYMMSQWIRQSENSLDAPTSSASGGAKCTEGVE
jgi:hypothetical protein